MLIGQWVDKDSTISLRNEPLHRGSAASEEQDGKREREREREIMRHVWVFASSVLSFQSSERCVGVCVCVDILLLGKLSPVGWNSIRKMSIFWHRGVEKERKTAVFQLDDIAFLALP